MRRHRELGGEERGQALFGIVQGGSFADLRAQARSLDDAQAALAVPALAQETAPQAAAEAPAADDGAIVVTGYRASLNASASIKRVAPTIVEIADKGGKVADAFGVPHSMGFAKRQAFLFKDGKLVWRDLAASTDQQAADVLKVIAENP